MRIRGALTDFLTNQDADAVNKLGASSLFDLPINHDVKLRIESIQDNQIEIKNLTKQLELLTKGRQNIFGFQNSIRMLTELNKPLTILHFSLQHCAGKLYAEADENCFNVVAGVFVDMSERQRPKEKVKDWDGS